MWKARFGQDSRVLGRKLLLNGEPYSVVGIASESLTIPTAPDLWVPLVIDSKRDARKPTVYG